MTEKAILQIDASALEKNAFRLDERHIRLECLKLAYSDGMSTISSRIQRAKEMADFVIGHSLDSEASK